MDEKILKKLEVFFDKYPLKKIKKGSVILKPGEITNKVGFIKSGYVRLYSTNESGQEITMQFFKPTLYLTIIYAMTDRKNEFYFEAITPVEMHEAPDKEVLDFLEENDDVNRELTNNIMTAFLDLIKHSSGLLAGNAMNRVAMMVYSLTNRMEGNTNDYAKIDFGITHKLIASLSGLTRETVTLQMIRLEKEGIIINKSKSIQVIDKEKLIKAANVG